MKINRHNLTIVQHCASKVLQGFITNGLQFTETGTRAVNRCYSVAVSALATNTKEPLGCITPAHVADILNGIGDEPHDLALADMPYMEGKPPVINWEKKPAAFEIYLNIDFLLKIAESARDFTEPRGKDEDPIIRIQFTGTEEPVRLSARNIGTAQKWEALLMPRLPATDAKTFAEAVPPPPSPPPPVEEDEFEKAMRLAQSL